MTFARPTLSDLVARAQADIDAKLPGADSRQRRNVLNVLARVHAAAMHGAYGMLADAARFLPDVAEGAVLARQAAIFGLVRKAAEAASGRVTIAGTAGVVVPIGAVLVRADAARYLVTAATAIGGGGTASVPVTAEGAGASGGMAEGRQLQFLSPVSGVQAIATVAAPGIAGGLDEEADEALRTRLLARLRAPVRGGAASDYEFWAREVAGVTRAWTYENWNGLGTVKVIFVMDGRADIIPQAADVAVVAAAIASRRPVGAEVTVAAPVPAPLDFAITLTPDSPAVRAAVTAQLDDLIAREAEPGGVLLISHIREAISLAAGETDHVVTAPVGNVVAAAGAIVTRGAIAW